MYIYETLDHVQDSKMTKYVVIEGEKVDIYPVLKDVSREYPVSYMTLLRHMKRGGIYRKRLLRVYKVEERERLMPHPGGPKFTGNQGNFY